MRELSQRFERIHCKVDDVQEAVGTIDDAPCDMTLHAQYALRCKGDRAHSSALDAFDLIA